MTWVRLDDQFPIHRKVGALSDAAFRLHVEALCWCARNLTDGRIEHEELRTVTRIGKADRYAAELVRWGVWRETGSGWEIHDYLTYQQSRSKVLQTREQRAKAGAEGGKRSGESRRAGKTAGQSGSGSKREAKTKQVASRSVEPPARLLPTEGTRDDRPPATRTAAGGVPDNPDWRTQPAFGTPRDPSDAQRAQRGAAAARANIRKPAATTPRRDAVAELEAATQPPPDDQPPPVISLRSA